ncbi:hypothetical protein ACF07V_05595 [Streptomyces sp. NPDC015661]|uniref:hypothetical protein n=1 Tax=Streptomyces sp. NPDC015661 TaxID=3364961 RepID=UPI0036F80A04
MNGDGNEYRTARFRDRLAREDVAELGVHVEVRGEAVLLTGTLPTASASSTPAPVHSTSPGSGCVRMPTPQTC